MHLGHLRPSPSVKLLHKNHTKLKIMVSSCLQKQQEVANLYHQAAEKHKGLVPDISPQQVWQLVQQNDTSLVLVDTRDLAEQEVSVLPGPTLTKAEFEGSKDQHRTSRVVCYCTVGVRSGHYAAELREQGFQAHNLEGSILGWTHAGYPLVELHNRAQHTKRVHVYGKRWALQADGYEAVMYPVPAVNLVKAGVSQLLTSLSSALSAPVRRWWAAPAPAPGELPERQAAAETQGKGGTDVK